MGILTPPSLARSLGDSNLVMAVHPLSLTYQGRCSFLEKPFMRDYTANYLGQVRLALVLSATLYAAFGALDAVLAPEIKKILWIIRFGIVCPIIFLLLLFSFSKHFIKYMQAVLCEIGRAHV